MSASVISAELVKKLREKTNAAMMDCKRALQESQGDLGAAEDWLRKKGAATAAKKASREAREGLIASYIHFDKIGVLVEVNCETDFVAKNQGFRDFVRDITLQIAAVTPLYVTRDEVPANVVEKEKEIAAAQIQGKPPKIVENIVKGKIDKYFSMVCLMEQPFVKDQNLTIRDLLTQKIAEIGENIVIRRFVRFQMGEELA